MTDCASPIQPAVVSEGNYIRQARLDKLATLRTLGINPYPYRFERSHANHALQTQYAELPNGTDTTDTVQVAGRIMALRNSGLFMDLQDESGKLQAFCHKDNLSEDQLTVLKQLDIGDWVGISGTIRRTPRGELSVKAQNLTVLSKSLLPLPEKYHGLTDVEVRYRQRYLDLIMNDETRHTLKQRSRIVTLVRQFLTERDFMEVETPMLQAIASGAAARPFQTHHNALDAELFLRIAPELFLKRLTVGGFERVFELNRCFRNEGIDTRHNPEFTMLELYQAFADYTDMMTLVETLIEHIAVALHGQPEVAFQGQTLSFKAPWPRRRMTELVAEATGIDFLAMDSAESARQQAEAVGVSVEANANWGQVVLAVFEDKVEASLIQPTHIIDFPREVSPLSKVHRADERLVERFESFANGWEIANAFSELTDPLDQRQRFEHQLAQRAAGDDEALPMDDDYLTALEYGLPPTGGLGIGIDRLVMLLTNSTSIRDVIAFPTLRPKA